MISLIVPVYNVRPYIVEFLDSVINQTYHNFEAILVDDGSNDGTECILDEYAAKYDNLRIIHKPNEGVVCTWKRGIIEARGEYLAFADPDDILKSDMLETLNKLMAENNADLVISGINRLEDGNLSSMPADSLNLAEGLYTGNKLESLKNNLFGNTENRKNTFFFARWNKLFKRDILLKNLDYTDDVVKFGDDVCMCASAIYDSQRLYYSHKPLYIYCIRNNSLTTVKFELSEIDNAERLRDSVINMITEKGCMNEFIYYNYPSYHILRLMRKIKETNMSTSDKRGYLSILKSHKFVKQYDLKYAKKYISFKRYIAIWLLKHSCYSILLKIL